ncbi:MAG: hypothetical protein ABI417_11055 [Coleofasciculaceae cyanobacterium]
MPATSRTVNFVAPINRDTICINLKAAAVFAGLSLVEDYALNATSDRSLVLRFIYPGSPAIFLEIKVTNARAISSRLYKDWNSSTHVGSNIAIAYSPTVVLFISGAVQIIAINHAEAKLLLITQRTVFQVCGVMRPLTKPSWWIEADYAFCFFPNTSFTAFAPFLPNSNNPYISSNSYGLLYTSALNANAPITNSPDVIKGGAIITSPNGTGISGVFSEEFAICAGTGKSRGDMIGDFLLLNPAISGLAIASNVPN